MNKSFLVFFQLAFLMLVSIPTLAQEEIKRPYKINFVIENLDDSIAYLGNHFGQKKYLLDTAVVTKGGQINFEGEKAIKTGVYFLYTPSYYMEFVIEKDLILGA